MTLLIDGDHLFVYRVGFGVENDPLGMQAARWNIEKSLSRVICNRQDSKYRIFLSGENNFRDKVATIFPYKGRRKERGHRPKYYNEIRDHLVQKYNAEVIEGMEADDALGIEQMKYTRKFRDKPSDISLEEAEVKGLAYDTIIMDSVIVASDKDLDMIPGWHYNPLKEKSYHVNELEAYRWFCAQWIAGDWECDDIPGLKGIGTKTGLKLLKDCKTEKEMEDKVKETYWIAKEPSHFDDTWFIRLKGKLSYTYKNIEEFEKLLKEIRQLVWIRRE